jgi:hypothetical protein
MMMMTDSFHDPVEMFEAAVNTGKLTQKEQEKVLKIIKEVKDEQQGA